MNRRVLAATAFAAFLFAGCEHADRIMETQFTPNADGTYTFRGPADVSYPIDSADGEAARLRMLAAWVKDNGVCPQGYSIVKRTPMLRNKGVFADRYDVFYTVSCRK